MHITQAEGSRTAMYDGSHVSIARMDGRYASGVYVRVCYGGRHTPAIDFEHSLSFRNKLRQSYEVSAYCGYWLLSSLQTDDGNGARLSKYKANT